MSIKDSKYIKSISGANLVSFIKTSPVWTKSVSNSFLETVKLWLDAS